MALSVSVTLPASISSSVIVTVVVVVAPPLTPEGSVPNVSSTLSPSSSRLSSVAVNVIDFPVSPLWKLTLAGTL